MSTDLRALVASKRKPLATGDKSSAKTITRQATRISELTAALERAHTSCEQMIFANNVQRARIAELEAAPEGERSSPFYRVMYEHFWTDHKGERVVSTSVYDEYASLADARRALVEFRTDQDNDSVLRSWIEEAVTVRRTIPETEV